MKRAAVITDLHFKFAETLANLRKENPDLVFSLGDHFGSEKRAPYPKELWRGEFLEFVRALGVPYYFIRADHEDEDLIAALLKGERFAPNLHFLENSGGIHLIEGLNIAVLGGSYSPNFYEKPRSYLQGARRRHYVRAEAYGLLRFRGVDLLLTHEWDDGLARDLGRPEILEVCQALKPKLHFAGNHHYHLVKDRGGRFCICLPRAGEMIYTFEFEEKTGEIHLSRAGRGAPR